MRPFFKASLIFKESSNEKVRMHTKIAGTDPSGVRVTVQFNGYLEQEDEQKIKKLMNGINDALGKRLAHPPENKP